MKITLDFSPLGPFADRLRMLSGEQLGRVAVGVVNTVTTKFDREQRLGQLADINLPASAIDEVTKVRLAATPASPRATITTQRKLTRMASYGARTYKRPSDRDSIGRRLGGRSGGVAVDIRRSGGERQDQWFMMPLKNTAGKMGVFVRTTASGGKPVHKYGPAPYTLFGHQIRTREDELRGDLERAGAQALVDAIQRALKA
jgi:hypothetical protein